MKSIADQLPAGVAPGESIPTGARTRRRTGPSAINFSINTAASGSALPMEG